MTRRMACALLMLSAFSSASLARQESAGELMGRVQSETGQGIPQATVAIFKLDSPGARETATDPTGSYQFPELPVGPYRVEITAQGFVPQKKDRVEISDAAVVKVDFQLRAVGRVPVDRVAQERNPNIFISKIDLNALRDPLRRGGLSPEFLQFSVLQNYFGADLGAPLRQIILVMPGESRGEFHGSLFEAHQNSVLNARPFFTVGGLKPSRRNQFGLNLTGPLFQDKLFFTTAFDAARESGFVNGNVLVPLPDERTPVAADPQTNRIVAALLQAFPAEEPNRPDILPRMLNTNAPRTINEDNWTLRVDYTASPTDALAFRYALSNYFEDPYELVVGRYPETDLRPQSFSATHVRTFSPATVTQSSFYFDRLRAVLVPTKRFRNLFQSLGIPNVPDIGFGGEFGDIGNFGPGTQFPRLRFQNRFGGNADIAYMKGKHRLHLGGQVMRIQLNDLQSDNTRGRFSFGNNFGRSTIENFLRGTPTRFTITLGDLYRGFRNWEYALYLQDSYQAMPRLTVTFGLRYEVITVPTEVNNLTLVPYQTDANNFAPQIAFAWNPGGGSTVVRGGYGISFGSVFPGTYQQARFDTPSVRTISIQNPSLVNPLAGLQIVTGRPERTELNQLSPDLVSPYAHQYNLVIAGSLPGNLTLEAGYIGNRSIKLFLQHYSNRARPVAGIPATTATIDQRRPDPRFLGIRTVMNSGMSYFDALKLSARKRFSAGLMLNADYVFSKDLTSGYDFAMPLNRESGIIVSQSEFDFQADLKAPSPFDMPHAFNLNFSYQLPFKKAGNPLADLLLANWQVSGATVFRTGSFYDITTSSDAPGFGNVDGEEDDRPNILNPVILGRSVGHPDTSTATLNPAYFDSNLPPGGRGTLGLRVFRKDDLNNTNLAFLKTFRLLKEGRTLQLRADFYNLFNHPYFERPGDVFPSPTFGKIVDTQNRGRVIQFMLRYSF